MSIDKSNLSKMLLIVDALPSDLIDAIGAAPGVGRPNWQQLAELVEKAPSPSETLSFAMSNEVQALPSVAKLPPGCPFAPRFSSCSISSPFGS